MTRASGRPTPQPWDDKDLRQVTSLWTEGKSASEIGKAMGRTRNAVLGKVHRLGLPKRRTVTVAPRRRADRLSPKLSPRPRVAVKRAAPIPPKPIAEEQHAPRYTPKVRLADPLPGTAPVAEITDVTGCKFPIGSYPFHWCNAAMVPGKSWCADHYAVVFQQSPKAIKGTDTFKSLGEALQGALK